MGVGITTYETTVKIGGTVWEDPDLDGMISEDENTISRREVELFKYNYNTNEWEYVESTLTDVNGVYEFTVEPTDYNLESEHYLKPNRYRAHITRKGYESFTLWEDGVTDHTIHKEENHIGETIEFTIVDTLEGIVDISSVRDDMTNHIGLIEYRTTVKIGDFIWHDENRNGLQDENEIGISDVKLKLQKLTNGEWKDFTDVNGNSEILTDENGNYEFIVMPTVYEAEEGYLLPIEYRVVVEIPESMEVTIKEENELINSDHVEVHAEYVVLRTANLIDFIDGIAQISTVRDDLDIDLGLVYIDTTEIVPTGVDNSKKLPIMMVFTTALFALISRKKEEEEE